MLEHVYKGAKAVWQNVPPNDDLTALVVCWKQRQEPRLLGGSQGTESIAQAG